MTPSSPAAATTCTSALWVLAAITVGGQLAGPLGMLLGVPAASAAYTLLKEATARRVQSRCPQREMMQDVQ